MLSRLFDLRLRSAEQAMRAGRLDDAYRVATLPDLRSDHRSRHLLSRLAVLFFDRARDHARADRFDEALRDLERVSAQADAKIQQKIDELRLHIETIVREQDDMDRSRHARLDEARRHLDEGALDAGQQLLKTNDANHPDARNVQSEILRRQRVAEKAYDRAEQYMVQNRWSAAADELRKALGVETDDERGRNLTEKVIGAVLGDAAEAFRAGRVRQARNHFDILEGLGGHSPSREEFAAILEAVEHTGDAVRRHDFDKALECALRLERLAPGAKWLKEAVKQIETAERSITSLMAGPLTELQNLQTPRPADRSTQETRLIARTADGNVETSLPSRMIVLVDGGGSYLLLRKPSVTIGSALSSKPADIPIFAPLKDRHAEIRRVEDEFFLIASEAAEVAGRTGKQHLLHDRDRIVLCRKAKLTFQRPSRRSASGILDLSDSTKAPNDIRRAILFHQTAMIGRGPRNHMICSTAEHSLVLFERSGGLWIKQAGADARGENAIPITLGQPLQYAGAAFVIRSWPQDQSGITT